MIGGEDERTRSVEVRGKGASDDAPVRLMPFAVGYKTGS